MIVKGNYQAVRTVAKIAGHQAKENIVDSVALRVLNRSIMPDEESIKFECPNCAQHIEGPAEMIGMETRCPACGKTIKVQTVPFILQKLQLEKPKKPILKWFIYVGISLAGAYVAVTWIVPILLGIIIGLTVGVDHTHSTPRQTSVPITGAFGFTLGQKLPEEYQIKEAYGNTAFVDITNTPPFTSVQLACLSDRTIYTIIGHGCLNGTEVVQALELKYGHDSFDYTTNSEHHSWTNGDCRLDATQNDYGKIGKLVEVRYTSRTLQQRSFDEDNKASHDVATNLAPKL
jgi:predicted RNA-binding Zn-ribbon protein involved in translation (DUF1610 family)